MPDTPAKSLPEEVAALTEAVHGLRDREVAGELARLREEVKNLREDQVHHHCDGHHHCGCVHWHYYPRVTWGAAGYPYTYTIACGQAAANTTAATNTLTTLTQPITNYSRSHEAAGMGQFWVTTANTDTALI